MPADNKDLNVELDLAGLTFEQAARDLVQQMRRRDETLADMKKTIDTFKDQIKERERRIRALADYIEHGQAELPLAS